MLLSSHLALVHHHTVTPRFSQGNKTLGNYLFK
jgi:hypothetical protein